MKSRTWENDLIFDIDSDGDNYTSFKTARTYILNKPGITDIRDRPGFFDDALLGFSYSGIAFRLEYSGFMGTELKCAAKLSKEETEKAMKFALEIEAVITNSI
jgi:hypothetical protein